MVVTESNRETRFWLLYIHLFFCLFTTCGYHTKWEMFFDFFFSIPRASQWRKNQEGGGDEKKVFRKTGLASQEKKKIDLTFPTLYTIYPPCVHTYKHTYIHRNRGLDRFSSLNNNLWRLCAAGVCVFLFFLFLSFLPLFPRLIYNDSLRLFFRRAGKKVGELFRFRTDA